MVGRVAMIERTDAVHGRVGDDMHAVLPGNAVRPEIEMPRRQVVGRVLLSARYRSCTRSGAPTKPPELRLRPGDIGLLCRTAAVQFRSMARSWRPGPDSGFRDCPGVLTWLVNHLRSW